MRGKDIYHLWPQPQPRITPAHAGKRPAPDAPAGAYRITPAHAGKSSQCQQVTMRPPDHPRPCGEKSANSHSCHASAGSPPAHAGKRTRWRAWNTAGRDHPRPCGEKPDISCLNCLNRDHPRPCGERTLCRRTLCRRTGSPPPMRGKVT